MGILGVFIYSTVIEMLFLWHMWHIMIIECQKITHHLIGKPSKKSMEFFMLSKTHPPHSPEKMKKIKIIWSKNHS